MFYLAYNYLKYNSLINLKGIFKKYFINVNNELEWFLRKLRFFIIVFDYRQDPSIPSLSRSLNLH